MQTRWSDKMCSNVISQVGFGQGNFKIVGSKRTTKPFVIPPIGSATRVFVLSGAELKSNLNFLWFLYYVVCPGKPDMCRGMKPVVGTSEMASSGF